MYEDGRYVYSAEQRQALEVLPVALAVYQFVQERVVTLLVSEGMCQLFDVSREDLIRKMDEDMFGSIHPDDVTMLAELGYQFATRESPYDVIFRARIAGKETYRTLHVIGKHLAMETGARVACFIYTDVTDTAQNQFRAFDQVDTPKSRFLDENTGALAIVSRNSRRLLYCNKALLRLLPPQTRFDSGITFDHFFFGKESKGIAGLFDAADLEPRIVVDPLTHRKFDVNVISCTYGDEPAYAAFFNVYVFQSNKKDRETALRNIRAAFNVAIFTGETSSLPYYAEGYRGFRVWNLTQNTFMLCSACNLLFACCGDSPTFDDCLQRLAALCCDEAQRAQIIAFTRERLLMLFESGTYPRQFSVTLQTEKGTIYATLALTMMRSPDSKDVFLKVAETNVTDDAILNMLVLKTVNQEYDYVAYSDLNTNRCRVISGRSSESGQSSFIVKTSERILSPSDIRSTPSLFPSHVHTLDDMHMYLLEACKANGSFTALQELPGGVTKSVYFELVDPQCQTFFIRCKDVTKLLQDERKRETELEQAVRAEHDKVERMLVQTMLSISNALDARDPLTRSHSQRVAQYSVEIARRLSWPEERVLNLHHIALLHDIGKIGISDALLQKKSSLTDTEFLQIQDHVAIGAFILKDFTAIDNVVEGALFHHERYDGTGYLRGLSGEQIPIEARIIGLADAVDAMNSTRPYRARQSESFITTELVAGRGSQFDPALVDIMLEMIGDGILNA